MGFARSRSLTVTADGANNQTIWNNLKKGGVAVISAPGTMTATVTLQRRGADGVARDVTDNAGNAVTFTRIGTYAINPYETQAEYRLNCKPGAFTAGPFTMALEGE